MKRKTVHKTLLEGYQIRDTSEHKTDVVEWVEEDAVTFFVTNNLDQTVYAEVRGTVHGSNVGGVKIGGGVTVVAGDEGAISLVKEVVGWLPFVYLVLYCTTAPTSGSVNARVVKLVTEG